MRHPDRAVRGWIGGVRAKTAFIEPRAVLQVRMPVLAPWFIAGGLFGFPTSVDNYPVSMFLTDVYHRTVPIVLLQFLGELPAPAIAAVCSVIIGLMLLMLIAGTGGWG